MRAAVLGGTFNPVHIGHLYLADEVRLSLGYERVIFVPANIPAHKSPAEEATSAERLEMLQRALHPYGCFAADPCEIERGGVSYSIETVRHLKERYGVEGKLGFIIGDDLIAGFDNWKDAGKLAREVDLIVAHRASTSERRFEYPHRYIDNIILAVSSSQIRSRIRTGRTARFLLPNTVWEYIQERRLYTQSKDTQGREEQA